MTLPSTRRTSSRLPYLIAHWFRPSGCSPIAVIILIVGALLAAGVVIEALTHQIRSVTSVSIAASPSPSFSHPAPMYAPDQRPPETTESPLIPVPTALPAGQAVAAERFATKFVLAWRRHPVSRAAWWASIRPMITADLAALMEQEQVDPQQIAATAVTGPATISSARPTGVIVRVQTDAGGVLVGLTPSGRLVDGVAYEDPQQPIDTSTTPAGGF